MRNEEYPVKPGAGQELYDVQQADVPNYQPALVMKIDSEPYGGPGKFYGAVCVLLSGYAMLWVGLVLMVTNRGPAVTAGWVLQGVGLAVVIIGSVITCIVMRPFHEKDKCGRIAIGAVVFGFVMLIPYCAILYTTNYVHHYGNNNDNEDSRRLDAFGNALARTLFTLYALCTLSIAGCVMGCFCCVKMRIPTTTTATTTTTTTVAVGEPV
eukprot:TRINITY_DN1259_c0_g1_i5.p1 TRINITY_DN1259_c0_g1~~TRINITY_DN1259_c0_g1_i5.p1  ORF type:complete len:230 (+),score=49.76 TRINITY_DN1259_c0_g1_i5:61-690(+)